jgi:glycosyltransferase involved in cell wall biosynthesis
MRFLFFTQYFPPEVGATQSRLDHFARHLVQKGHQVTVITELPNHPRGVIFPGYRRRLLLRTDEDGLDVIRLWVYTSPRKSSLRRLLFYFSYMIFAIIAGLFIARGRYDSVFASSPPLPVALAGLIVAWFKRRPLVMDVRDLWPTVGIALGEIRGQTMIRMAEWLELLLYRRAVAITCVTHSFIEYIADKGIDRDKLRFVPNGTMPNIFRPQPSEKSARKSLGLEGQFVVGFCGNHGVAQGLPGVVEASLLLRDVPGVKFLFVGEGPYKQQLLDTRDRERLDNLLLLPEVPITEIARYINACDLMLVPLRKDKIFDMFIPSKLFDYMACARPIVLTVDGEARSILEQAKGGVFVEPDNPQALAKAVSELRQRPQELQEMGQRGRNYVLQHYLRDTQAEKLEEILEKCARS